MAQSTNQQQLNSKVAKARPWVPRFLEERQDGRPWGYAIFEDPTIDEEQYEEFWCRVDVILAEAKGAVFGRDPYTLPKFKFEHLDWPEDDEAESACEQVSELNISNATTSADEQLEAEGWVMVETACEDIEEDDANVSQNDDSNMEVDEEDDADIETVRELDKLRAHFKRVRDRAKKRRRSFDPVDMDRNGIPRGLLRNVFLVIDQDVIDSVLGISHVVDDAWIWAIDPDYHGDVAAMTKNGLKDEYYGYMRVRLQQLVNNFWDVRLYHEDELPMPRLWQAAQHSHKYAFVSVDPAEARMWYGAMMVGTALRPTSG